MKSNDHLPGCPQIVSNAFNLGEMDMADLDGFTVAQIVGNLRVWKALIDHRERAEIGLKSLEST